MRTLWFADLGVIGYAECLNFQRSLIERRLAGEIEDTLLLLEHTPVITMGTSGGEDALLVSEESLSRAGIELYRTDRGGNITYHGPGQLVGYPIFDLREHDKDVHLFLRNLERVVIGCLADFGIQGEAVQGLTGVWVGGDKICSIGVAARRWISYHGFAVNVSPNLQHWAMIHPCGLVGRHVAAIDRLAPTSPTMAEVKASIVSNCAKVFGMKPRHVSREELASIGSGSGDGGVG